MTEESQTKSLDDWVQEINKSKASWLGFYAEMLGVRASNVPRLYRTVNMYGFWPVFESIIETSTREITGDPLNYVLKVAANKWREAMEEANEESSYSNALQQSKASSQKANISLAKKIERAKGKRK